LINTVVPSLDDCSVIINGVLVEGIESITWAARLGEPTRVTMTMLGATGEIVGEIDETEPCGNTLQLFPTREPSQSLVCALIKGHRGDHRCRMEGLPEDTTWT
jgi:hypothetical protein